MALTRVFLTVYVLLLPLLVRSARDYGYGPASDTVNSDYVPTPVPAPYTTQPESVPKPKNDQTKPADYTPKPTPDVAKPNYSPKPSSSDAVKTGYSPKPSSESVSPGYTPVATSDAVKPDYSSKPTPVATKSYNSPNTNSDVAKPTSSPSDSPNVAETEYKPLPQPKPKADSSSYTPTPKADVVKPVSDTTSDNVKPYPKPDTTTAGTNYDSESKAGAAKRDQGSSSKSTPDTTSYDNPTSTPSSAKPNYDSKPESSGAKPNSGNGAPLIVGLPVTVSKPDDEALNYGDVPPVESPLPVGIEGLVLCKSGPSYVPIQGAVAKIICSAVGQNGYETKPFSCLTDAKGYFFQTLPGLDDDKLKLIDCTAFLESSPLETCKLPTDVNKGITGAPLSKYRVLNDKKIKLFSVGPFFYTSEPASTPGGY